MRAQWRSLLLLVLIVWYLLSSTYRSALAPSQGITGIDFQIYYEAAQRLAHGEPLYIFRPAGDTYVYSPLLALLLRPLAHVQYPHALKIWFFLMALCLGASVMLYALAARFTWRDLALTGITLIIGFRFWPSMMNFSLGQVNFLILMCICGMFLADSRGRPRWIALLIVAAALIKTWMLGLLIYLALRRRWKEMISGVCAYTLLLLASFGAVGWREWPLFWKLTAGYANQSIGQIAATQSISGFAYLHFKNNPHITPFVENALIAHTFIAGGFALMLAGFAHVARNAPRQPSYEARLQLGFVILSVLLMLPMCQSEYFVFGLPLLWTLIAPTPVTANERRLSLPIMLASLAIYALFTRGWPCTPPIPEFYRHGLPSLCVSANFFAAFALWLLTFHVIRRARTPIPTPLHLPVPAR